MPTRLRRSLFACTLLAAVACRRAAPSGGGHATSTTSPESAVRFVSLSAAVRGGARVYAALSDGTVWQWTRAGVGQPWRPSRVAGLDRVVEVAAGQEFACARTVRGEVLCWGRSALGALGRGASSSEVVPPTRVAGVAGARALAATTAAACAVDGAGAVWCWGLVPSADGHEVSESPRALPGVTGATSVHVGLREVIARLADGTARRWAIVQRGEGYGLDGPTELPWLAGARAVAVCENYGCAIARDGATLCWGWGHEPRPVAGVTNAESVGCTEHILDNENTAGTMWLVGEGEACARTGASMRCWTHGGSDLDNDLTRDDPGDATIAPPGAAITYAVDDGDETFPCVWTATEARCDTGLVPLPTAADRAAPPRVVAPSRAPVAQVGDAATGCVIAARASFHLRPTDLVASVGPELAAGTRMQVLSAGGQRRRAMRSYRVRVLGAVAQEGYVFLAVDEVPAGCGGR